MKAFSKYFILLATTLTPLTSYSDEPVKIVQAHKPPILTTTAIIEIYEGEKFNGIVLIERGKAP